MKNIIILFLFNIFTLIKSYSLDSNNFYSKKILSTSNNFNSNYFNSHLYNSVSLKSKNYNSYLSFVTSNDYQLSKSIHYSFLLLSTKKPTLSPTTVKPSLSPTINNKKTFKPTTINVPIISFDTQLLFNNYDAVELDKKSQSAIIISTANSMNLSSSFIKYLGTKIQITRKLFQIIFKLQGFNIAVSLQTNIPLQGKYSSFVTNPTALYSQITTNLVNSVNSGLFISYLQAASLNLNITSFENSTVLSVKSDNFVIQKPNTEIRTYNSDKDIEKDINSIIYVIIFTIIILTLVKISYEHQTKKKPFTCVKLTSLNLTTSEVVITVNENNQK